MMLWKARDYALLLAGVLLVQGNMPAFAGDEDIPAEKQAQEAAAPTVVPAPLPPPAPEAVPDPVAEQVPDPIAKVDKEPLEPNKPTLPAPRGVYDPDKNIDFAEVMDNLDSQGLMGGVLPPSLGFRGYRPNMIAIGYADRTPGVGGMVEYSWNRFAMGVALSTRNLNEIVSNRLVKRQTFANLYGLYRWLPFDISPYFLLGAEIGVSTQENFGGMLGLGMEANLYRGLTLLVGYTYHRVVYNGFFGGSLGWSF